MDSLSTQLETVLAPADPPMTYHIAAAGSPAGVIASREADTPVHVASACKAIVNSLRLRIKLSHRRSYPDRGGR